MVIMLVGSFTLLLVSLNTIFGCFIIRRVGGERAIAWVNRAPYMWMAVAAIMLWPLTLWKCHTQKDKL